MRTLLLLSFFSQALFAATVRTDRKCPACADETCRWELRSAVDKATGTVKVDWDKSVVSRHVEKPLAVALHCNVDRSFDAEAGGYIKVWFEGEKNACDPMKTDPADCGVTFLYESGVTSDFPSGFTAKAPTGKKIVRVEHYSTILLNCGNFAEAKLTDTSKWKARLGWSADGPGDGTFAKDGE